MEPKQNKTRTNSALKQKNIKKKIEAALALFFFFFSSLWSHSLLNSNKKKEKKEGEVAGVPFFDAKTRGGDNNAAVAFFATRE
jgi:hypothetical protein